MRNEAQALSLPATSLNGCATLDDHLSINRSIVIAYPCVRHLIQAILLPSFVRAFKGAHSIAAGVNGMREPDWKKEIRDGVRKENWTLTGVNRVVKVVPLAWSSQDTAGGYITLARLLNGRTPERIEKDLGLPADFLKSGARIYRFTRLPQPSEYDFELTAKYPGGLAHNPAHGDERYGPGSDKINQWRIHEGVRIPVDEKSAISLAPKQKFSDIP